MNGARTTYMRKGYLLTALAAAVLLAASSGTAWAQSIGFDKTSGSVMENAFSWDLAPSPRSTLRWRLKVRVSGLPPVGDTKRAAGELATTLGAVTVSQHQPENAAGRSIGFRPRPISGRSRPPCPWWTRRRVYGSPSSALMR